MNPIEALRDDLARRFPGLWAEIDAPDLETGPWFLDVRPGGDIPLIVVEWQAGRGFGVAILGSDDWPDEHYSDVKDASNRVVALILSGGPIVPPSPALITRMRRALGQGATEVAAQAEGRPE